MRIDPPLCTVEIAFRITSRHLHRQWSFPIIVIAMRRMVRRRKWVLCRVPDYAALSFNFPPLFSGLLQQCGIIQSSDYNSLRKLSRRSPGRKRRGDILTGRVLARISSFKVRFASKYIFVVSTDS